MQEKLTGGTAMMKLTLDRIVEIGAGIKTTTYFKLMYPIYSGDDDYSILHMAVFGMN